MKTTIHSAVCNGLHFTVNIFKAVQSLLAIYSTWVNSAVLYMLLFDGEGQPLTYLTCTSAWGGLLYFSLHYKVLPALYQAEHVWFMDNTSVYLISHWPLSLHSISLPSPTSTKEATLPKLFQAGKGYMLHTPLLLL